MSVFRLFCYGLRYLTPISGMSGCLVGLLILTLPSRAELFFPPSLISGDTGIVANLSHFETPGSQLPGVYPVEVWLNGDMAFSKAIKFVPIKEFNHASVQGEKPALINEHIRDTTGLMACLTRKDLSNLQVNTQFFPDLPRMQDDECTTLGTYIPGAWTFFDFQKMRLSVSIPQIAMQNQARGYIPPEKWDEGINAALLTYGFSGSDSQGRYGNSHNKYLNLESGLNIGPWRLRDRRNWTGYSSRYGNYQRWQHGTTTLSRAIIPWRSELILGDGTSNGDVFESYGFRGIRLATEDAMLPDSLRGYAPVIRGTAGSNARVSVHQNGYEIYQTTVAPGEFAISDLHPMYASGDLVVTVTEADGSTRSFSVPYSAVPVMVREGQTRYDVTVGNYRDTGGLYDDPIVIQGTLIRGLAHGMTVYGGGQYTDKYWSAALGAGINMGTFGAISADITHAESTMSDGHQHQGQSLRFLYARSLNTLGTTFQLTGYRYSTRGFYTLREASLKRISGWRNDTEEVDTEGQLVKRTGTDFYNMYDSKRQRVQANISQRLGNIGSLYLTGSRESFWNREGVSESLQAGFSSSLGFASYSLSVSHSRIAGFAETDRSVWMSISLPLTQWLPGNSSPIYASFTGSRDGRGVMTQQTGLSGSLLSERNLNWSVTQGHSQESGNTSSARLDYRGTYANSNLGYSHSNSHRQLSYGAAGGIVLHHDGLTLSQPLGDTNILVAAPGASGVALENGTGVRTDWRGYTVRPWASGYRENRVALNTTTLDDRTEIEGAVARVVPTRGALTRADFKTRTGTRALLTLTHKGRHLPFGTVVSGDENSGIVSDDGQVYLAGLAPEGILKARWGDGKDQACTIKYQIPENEYEASLVQLQTVCQ